jgi:hypothetical protein
MAGEVQQLTFHRLAGMIQPASLIAVVSKARKR